MMTTFETSDFNTTVTERFERMATLHAMQCALQTAQATWSYAELNQAANQIAHRLLQQEGAAGGQVIVFCAALVWQIAALLAVIKAGKTVIVADTSLPDARLGFIFGDSEATTVLVDTPLAARATAILATVDEPSSLITPLVVDTPGAATAVANPALVIDPDTPLAMIYTSGSTGNPKGVVRSHRAQMQNIWRFYQRSNLPTPCRGGVSSSLAYAATFGLTLRLLLQGSTIYAYDLTAGSLPGFSQWLTQERIHFIIPPIALARQWCNSLTAPVELPDLQLVEFVGAQINKQDLQQLRAKVLGDYTIALVYGATETLNVTNYLVGDLAQLPEGALPGGYFSADKAVLVLDEQGEAVAQGQVGEIVIASRYIGTGYWRRAALTAAKFRSDPQEPTRRLFFTGDLGYLADDGCLYITGRKDFMVKVRGYLVELTEVEQVLAAVNGVAQAVVVAHEPATAEPNSGAEKELTAYWVREPQAALTQPQLRTQLTERLPAYMLPTHFVELAALPLTPNGKIDRRALPAPTLNQGDAAGAAAAPRTPTEQALLQIWRHLLQREAIGFHDNFFALGGHSLLALRLLVQVEQHFQCALELRSFVFTPTIAHMAALLDNRQTAMALGQPASVAATTPLPNQETLAMLYAALTEPHKMQQLRRATRPTKAQPRWLQLLSRLPQPLAMTSLAWLVQQRWVQQRYLPKQTKVVQQFLAGLEPPRLPMHLPETILARALFFGFLQHFQLRGAIFQRLRRQPPLPVAGMPLLAKARAQQQGVILLTSHDYQAPYFRTLGVMQRTIANMAPLVQPHAVEPVMAESLLYARQLELARQILQQGGVIAIAPDVNRGHGPQTVVEFHGRLHQFRTGFAELALLTDAQLFFVASDLQAYNRFSFRMVGPFDRGSATMRYEERVQHLMNQYIEQLRIQWAKNPWALPWWLMREQLAYPPARQFTEMV
jgi:acyl-coenzyme A synthetase/AMP-(fatty) acid ligase